jgi:PII-like signaling protein
MAQKVVSYSKALIMLIKQREEGIVPKIAGKAKRLRIYLGESDHWQRRSLYQAIVEKAKELDMAGATVFRGLIGYGANSRIHTAKLVDLSSDLPVLVEIVDSEEYIEKLLPYLDEMLEEGMITIDDIEVIKYGRKPPKR